KTVRPQPAQQRGDVAGEEPIGDRQRAVVAVVAQVGGDPDEGRQAPAALIGGELPEADELRAAPRRARYIVVVDERVVPLGIAARFGSLKARPGNVLAICLP